MVYRFFDKETKDSVVILANKSAIPENEQLAEELHKPIIRKFAKGKYILQIQRQYLGCRFGRYAINK